MATTKVSASIIFFPKGFLVEKDSKTGTWIGDDHEYMPELRVVLPTMEDVYILV